MIQVLQVCLRVPFPPLDGGTIAMYTMANALNAAGATVKVVALNTRKHFVDPASLPETFVNNFKPEMVYIDASVRPLPALINIFTNKSYNISRFDVSLMHDELKRILSEKEFDIIQLESLFMAPYIDTIKKYSRAKIILRAHNVEYRIWERLAHSTGFAAKKWYLNLLSKRLRKYESNVFSKFDGIIALTGDDRDLIKSTGCNVPLLVSPIGIDTRNYQNKSANTNSTSVFHLGSMDWLPNIEAIDWFLDKVYPLLVNDVANFSLHLAGKNMPDRFFNLNLPNVHVTGRVNDAGGFMHDKQIMIVPLLSGGGMRVKIIEGMAMGKTIISTTIGAEGILYENGKNIVIADSPEDFSNAIMKCLSDINFSNLIGKNAQKLAVDKYDIRVVGSGVIEFFKSIEAGNKFQKEPLSKPLS